jgi:formylglycine-generating enzyme required for sulfatase activity
MMSTPLSTTWSQASRVAVMGLCGLALLAAADQGPATAPREFTTPSGIAMILIPAGEFQMGDARGADDAKPVHRVTLRSFCMDKFEVTQQSFMALTGLNTSKVEGERNPVEQTSWVHAARYCNARSEKEGLKPCYDTKTWACDVAADGYRLPTEAEWEYACRAGSATAYGFGEDAAQLPLHAWVKSNASGTPHPVGSKRPNAWGLFDLHGNVLEWCNDYYAADAYKNSPATDPSGPVSGELRVLRGGGWRSLPKAATAACRAKDSPMNLDTCLGYPDYGFRCVRRAPPATP